MAKSRTILLLVLYVIFLGTLPRSFAEEDLAPVPIPRATPVEDLLPKFDHQGMVISRSKQFEIIGGESKERGSAANLAEDIRDQFLSLLELEPEAVDQVKIRIHLKGKVGDPSPKRDSVIQISYQDTAFVVELFVHLAKGLNETNFRRSVTEALLYSGGLTGKKIDENVKYNIPPWVIEGLLEASAWQQKRAERKLYETLFKHGGLFTPDDLFSKNQADYLQTDSASKIAFRVSSGAMIMALTEQPEGKIAMRSFLAELPAYQGEMPDLLRNHFPELSLSTSSLSKWWALQLANKGVAPLTESLSILETEAALAKLLVAQVLDQKGAHQELPLRDLESFNELEPPEKNQAIKLMLSEIVQLSYRCFPSYRPLLNEYQFLLHQLSSGKTKDISQRLKTLEETRLNLVKNAERAKDFLNWFEITRARETSGSFDDYFKLKNDLKQIRKKRNDPISEHLDRIAPLFELPK